MAEDMRRRVISVSVLTSTIKELLEMGFPEVWIEGEISNVSRPASGHVYFSLRDSQAQLKAVMYRGEASRCPFQLKDGLEVIAAGRISVYPPSGQYQLVVNSLQPKGMGAQELRLRQLKEKLARLGYFAAERKRPLLAYPETIGIVTSPSGAAIRDMLEVFRERWPSSRILLFPVRVQGDMAAREVADAIHLANDLVESGMPIDALIVGRGGGSAEDLAAFNEETVAKAIFESRIRIVSAVGHEIDVSIADMVADVRALTPTQAAVLCTPSRPELLAQFEGTLRRMGELLRRKAENARLRLKVISQHAAFRSPLDGIRERERRLDEIGEKLQRKVGDKRTALQSSLATLAGRLESLSPLKVLARGYSLTQDEITGQLANATDAKVGGRIRTRLADGFLVSRIEEIAKAP